MRGSGKSGARGAQVVLVLAALWGACGGPLPEGRNAQDVIYGADDRQDYYQVTEQPWRDIAYRSATAMISADFVNTSNPQDVKIEFDTMGVYEDLCPGQRYADQVAAADCSGTLIDDDLVLTAGHCVELTSYCTDSRFVFRYVMTSATTLGTITTDDVFRCEQILVRTIDDFGSDHAIVRLDRAATPRHQPAAVAKTLVPVQAGSTFVSISFPDGIPVKVDANGLVLDDGAPQLEYFTGTMDVFAGSSGSGVFDASGLLFGIEVRGENDWRRQGNCWVVRQLAADGSQGYEDISYAARAVQALCAQGYQSQRLCGSGADGGTTQLDGGTGTPDAGVPDAGVADAGVADAGVADAGVADAGVADAGVADAGVTDAGVTDAGVADAGVADAGVADAGVADAGVADAGSGGDAGPGGADAGVGPAGVTSGGCSAAGHRFPSGWMLGLLLLALAATRRRRRPTVDRPNRHAGS